MKKLRVYFKKSRWFILTTLFVFIIFFIGFCLSFSDFGGANNSISQLNQWIRAHYTVLLLWHVVLLIAIYLGWVIRIKRIKPDDPNASNRIKYYTLLKWASLGFILVIDGIHFLT